MIATEELTKPEEMQIVSPITDITEWNPTDEEPNLDIYIRTRRTLDAKGQPCSQWEYKVVVEGNPEIIPTQVQRDYASTAIRHIARVHQDVNLDDHLKLASNLARIARMLRAELKATMNMYVNLTEHLVRTDGLLGAASILGLKEYKVKHLLKSRGQLPSDLERKSLVD